MLETQLAAMIVEASDGNIALLELELLSSEMGLDSATFNLRLSLTGDFQRGIQSIAKSMGAELTEEEPQVDEILFCEFESYDFHISFAKERLTVEAETGGTIRGDLDAQINAIKDMSLEQLLESGVDWDELKAELGIEGPPPWAGGPKKATKGQPPWAGGWKNKEDGS